MVARRGPHVDTGRVLMSAPDGELLCCGQILRRLTPLHVLRKTSPMTSAPIKDPAHALRFLLAGNAHATFVSLKTETRFTYKVVMADPRSGDTRAPPHFVSVLTGPDRYEYLGTIFGSKIYMHGKRSRVSETAPSELAFAWVWQRLTAGRVPENIEVYHEGRCGRCNRRLTTPESVTLGIGPECEKKMGAAS